MENSDNYNNQIDISLIEKEYFHLQSMVEKFDDKSLTIKAWSVSLVGAIIGAGLTADKSILLFVAGLVCLMFWIIDASWKIFQYAYFERISEIESYMNGETKTIKIFQITSSWFKGFHQNKMKIFNVMFWVHIFLPHGAMFFLLFIIYFLM